MVSNDDRRLHIRKKIQALDDDIANRRGPKSNNNQNSASHGYKFDVEAIKALDTNAKIDEFAIALLGGPEVVRAIANDLLMGEPKSRDRSMAIDRWMIGLKPSRGRE